MSLVLRGKVIKWGGGKKLIWVGGSHPPVAHLKQRDARDHTPSCTPPVPETPLSTSFIKTSEKADQDQETVETAFVECLPLMHTSLATPTVITCPGGRERPKSWIRDAQKSYLSNSHSESLQIRMNSFFETCTSKRRLCHASGTTVSGCHASAWVNPRRVEGHQTARPSPGRGTTLRARWPWCATTKMRNSKRSKPGNSALQF